MNKDSRIPIQISAYRTPGLSFCALEDVVIVLDPNQGIYYRLSHDLARLLQEVPVRESEFEYRGGVEFAPLVTGFRDQLFALSRAGLIESVLDEEDLASIPPVSEVSVWGSMTTLTQIPGGSPSFGPPNTI